MQVLVDHQYKQFITTSEDQVDTDYRSDQKYDCIIADQNTYQRILTKNENALATVPYKFLIVSEEEKLPVTLFRQIVPSVVLDHRHGDEISKKIIEVQITHRQKEQAEHARDSVENKRSELERLNEFLSYQDKERSTALKIFHLEEHSKKQHEKQLLFFLDFINSNYSKSSFLDELLQYLWKELKKIGTHFYQLGIIIKLEGDSESILFQYDDRKYYSQKQVKTDIHQIENANQMALFLANIYQRPVGKILFWKEKHAIEFCLYLETQGHEFNATIVESFISDRLSLLSLIISRWITEKSEQTLLRQWHSTFKAYKDPIHVIDEDFNIIQANYSGSGKCFEVLAQRQSQCLHCPLLDKKENKSVVEIQQQHYQVYSSAFTALKKYYLLFYGNMTEMNKLKSQFIQSEKMNTIGNLANHLAHELNNPLTGLKLASENLISEIQNQNPDAAAVHFMNDLNEVLKATHRSERIIKDLVDFSSNDSKELQAVDFSIVLKKTMTLLKSVLRSTRIFIDVKSSMIKAQPVYLQQVIFNLIKNACEAMGSQGNIKIYQGVPHSEYMDFVIEDTGPGISEKLQQDLFKPFFTTKQEGEGTGLGLYLCASMMNKMNGELVYDKSYKSGARFILRFRT